MTAIPSGTADGVTLAGGDSVVGLTTFTNYNGVETNAVCCDERHPVYAYSAADSISSHLSRPTNFSSGALSSATGPLASSVINMGNIATFCPRVNMLNGAYGFRATVCIRVDVSSTPFTQGVLKLAYLPGSTLGFVANPVSSSGGAFWNNALTSLCPVSQCPGVYLDITEANTATLRIPWVSPTEYATFACSGGTALAAGVWGTFALHQYLPTLLGTGGTMPTFNLWSWLEDVETIGNTPWIVTKAAPQAGYAVMEKEMANTDKPISKFLALTGRAVAALSGVPYISAYTGTAAWLIRALGNTASSFGWSKPRDTTTTHRMMPSNTAAEGLHTGVSPCLTLSAAADNYIVPMPLAGTGLDEMAFEYLLSIKTAVCTGVFSSVDTESVLKFGAIVSPSAMFYQNWNGLTMATHTITATANASTPGCTIWPSPLFFLGQCFRYWRGDIVFTIRMAKTKMHTGKIRCYFIPESVDTSVPGLTTTQFVVPTAALELNYISTVYDLRGDNVFEFVVPYTSPNTFTPFSAGIGTFGILVDEVINYPNLVSSIPFAIEVSARNMVFSAPTGPAYAHSLSLPIASTVVAQSGDTLMNNTRKLQYCAGETFSSVKQIVARASYVLPSGTAYTVPNVSQYVPTQATGTGPYTAVAINSCTMLDYIGGMYAYWRGSTNIHVHQTGSSATILNSSIQLTAAGTTTNPLVTNGYMNSLVQEHAPYAHASVPYYSCTAAQYIRPTTRTPINTSTPLYEMNAKVNSLANVTTIGATVGTSAADDFQFGGFICCPPLILPFAATANWTGSSARFPS
jgi:hypothetical protein